MLSSLYQIEPKVLVTVEDNVAVIGLILASLFLILKFPSENKVPAIMNHRASSVHGSPKIIGHRPREHMVFMSMFFSCS